MDKQIGPYSIVRLIGSGGMGSVYEALHIQIQRRAAVKVLSKDFQQDSEFVQRFFNEARAVNIINHPNIVTVYDFGTASDGSPYIVMEYLEGDSLRQRLARSGRLAPEVAMRIGKQIAAGLAAAHAKQVVHRDLKPINILLARDTESLDGERAKILDFGIAKLTTEPGAKQLTRMGVSMGTPAYMSPEQCKSARDVSDRSDVYALGLILFEMLTGEHPFADARSDSAMMASHLGKEPPLLAEKAPGAPAELYALVHRMLAKQPEARPSAAEVTAILARLSGSMTGMMPLVEFPQGEGSSTSALLSRTASTVHERPRSEASALWHRLHSGRAMIIVAGAALLLGISGVIGFGQALLRSSGPSYESVRWSITTTPPGAQVIDATGQVIGTTPFQSPASRGTGIEILSLHLEGYADQRLPLDRSRDVSHSVTMTALPPPAPQIAAEPPRPPEEPPARPRTKKASRKKRHGRSVK